jgi:hypothetical protein
VLCIALHWILSPEPITSVTLSIPLVEDLVSSPDYLNSGTGITWLKKSLNVNPDQIQRTVSATVGQRENGLWAAVRKLRFTASNFGDILLAVKHNRQVIANFFHAIMLNIFSYTVYSLDNIVWRFTVHHCDLTIMFQVIQLVA